MRALSKAVQDYLSLRRKLGYKLREAGPWLADFISFLKREGASYVTTELSLRWAMLPVKAQPAHWATRLRVVRLFAEYHRASDSRTEIPSPGLLPYRPHRKQPHIYRDHEIRRLIKAARGLPSKTGLRPWTYSTLFGVLAVTGLRIGETLALNRADVDLAEGVLTIRQTKFGKTRLVPIHPSTQDALRGYASRRDRIYRQPKTPGFFVSERGTRLEKSCVCRAFHSLSRQIGLRGPSDRHGPRLHDFRHSFAVQTLLGWYRSGVDVEPQLPKLSTYLGHTHVSDTYWYLSAIPELLHLAARRLETKHGGVFS